MKKVKINYLRCITVLIPFFLSSCYSLKKTVEESKPHSAEIDWPKNYIPEKSKFFVHNEIDIIADPQEVWNILIAAEEWESYYMGASDFKFTDSNSSGKLESTSVFSWKTMGQYFTSTVKEYKPPYRLSWESNKKSIQGYHAWLIIPTEKGCKLVTSEAQHGFMASMEKRFVPNKLERLHDVWLAQIKKKAEETLQK